MVNLIDKLNELSKEELVQHVISLEKSLGSALQELADLTTQNSNMLKKLMEVEDELTHTKSTLKFYTDKFTAVKFAAKTEEDAE